ncbi:unnamed protein product [Effrenium voratum]|nr:unnamed protein product [Effrenium voratum]
MPPEHAFHVALTSTSRIPAQVAAFAADAVRRRRLHCKSLGLVKQQQIQRPRSLLAFCFVFLAAGPPLCNAQVTNVVFTDNWNELWKLRGTISWDPPADVTGITHYNVFQACSPDLSFEQTADPDGTLAGFPFAVAWGPNGEDYDVPVGTNEMYSVNAADGSYWKACGQGQYQQPYAAYFIVKPMPDQGSATWGIGHCFDWHLSAAPAPPLNFVSFTDTDPDAGEIAGTLVWEVQGTYNYDWDPTLLSHYAIYSAQDTGGTGEVELAQVRLPDTSYTFPENTDQQGGVCFLIYGYNQDGRASTASVSHCFESMSGTFTTTSVTTVTATTSTSLTVTADPGQVTITNVAFTDTVTDIFWVLGTVTWTAPSNPNFAHFQVVIAQTADGANGGVLSDNTYGTEVPVGVNQLEIPVGSGRGVARRDTLGNWANYVVVFAFRTDINAYSPASEAGSFMITDLADSNGNLGGSWAGDGLVASVQFTDENANHLQITGTISWTFETTTDYGFVSDWKIYLAEDETGTNKQELATVAKTETQVAVDAATQDSFLYVMVYAYNEHGESPTGVAAYMWDDGRPPLPTTTSSTTTSTTLDFPGCTSVTFSDTDSAANQLGGTVSWVEPTDTTYFDYWTVYQSTTRDNSNGQIVQDSGGATQFAIGTTSMTLGSAQARQTSDAQPANWIVVLGYRNDLAAYQNPYSGCAVPLYDDSGAAPSTGPFVADLAFDDQDTSWEYAAGPVTWTLDQLTADQASVSHYTIYLAEDATGTNRMLVATVARDTTTFEVATTSIGYRNFVVMYSSNSYGEAASPVGTEYQAKSPLTTTTSSMTATSTMTQTVTTLTTLTTLTGTTTSLFTIGVSNAVFNDENDEFGRMSGYVSWDEPANAVADNIIEYRVRLAFDVAATLEQIWYEPNSFTTYVPVGTTRWDLIPGTGRKFSGRSFEEWPGNWLIVYTVKDVVGEQAVEYAAKIRLWDNQTTNVADTIYVNDLAFTDTTPVESAGVSVSGTLSWTVTGPEMPGPGEDWTIVDGFDIYLSEGISISATERYLGSVDVGTNSFTIPLTTLSGADTFLVYSKNHVGKAPYASVIQFGDHGGLETTSTTTATSTTTKPVTSMADKQVVFSDTNSVANQLEGVITWEPPDQTSGISWYEVYLSYDQEGSYKTLVQNANIGSAYTSVGTNTLTLLSPTTRETSDSSFPANWISVYPSFSGTLASHFDSAHIRLYDDSGAVPPQPALTSLEFTDEDAQGGVVSGTVRWAPAADADLAFTTQYVVYLASDQAGTDKIQFGDPVAVGTNEVTVSSGVTIGSRYHVLVYAQNGYGDSSSPGYVGTPSDTSLVISDLGSSTTTTSTVVTSTVTTSSSSFTSTASSSTVFITLTSSTATTLTTTSTVVTATTTLSSTISSSTTLTATTTPTTTSLTSTSVTTTTSTRTTTSVTITSSTITTQTSTSVTVTSSTVSSTLTTVTSSTTQTSSSSSTSLTSTSSTRTTQTTTSFTVTTSTQTSLTVTSVTSTVTTSTSSTGTSTSSTFTSTSATTTTTRRHPAWLDAALAAADAARDGALAANLSAAEADAAGIAAARSAAIAAAQSENITGVVELASLAGEAAAYCALRYGQPAGEVVKTAAVAASEAAAELGGSATQQAAAAAAAAVAAGTPIGLTTEESILAGAVGAGEVAQKSAANSGSTAAQQAAAAGAAAAATAAAGGLDTAQQAVAAADAAKAAGLAAGLSTSEAEAAGISAASAAAIAAGQSQNITSVAELAALAGEAAANSSQQYGQSPQEVTKTAAVAASEAAGDLGGSAAQQAAAAAAAAVAAGSQVGLTTEESILAGAVGAGEVAQKSAANSGSTAAQQAAAAGAAAAATAAAGGLDTAQQAVAAADAAKAAGLAAGLSTSEAEAAGISAASAAAIAAGQSQNITSVAELAALAGEAAANCSQRYGQSPLEVVKTAAVASSEAAGDLGGSAAQQAAAAAAAAVAAGSQVGLTAEESILAGAAGAGEVAQQSAANSGSTAAQQAAAAGAAAAATAAAGGLDTAQQAVAAADAAKAAGISAASAAAIAAGQSQNITSVAELAALAGEAAANLSQQYGQSPQEVTKTAAVAASEAAGDLGGSAAQQAAAAAAAAVAAGSQVGLTTEESILAGAAGAGEVAQQSAANNGTAVQQAAAAGAAAAATAAAGGLDTAQQAIAAADAAKAAGLAAGLSTSEAEAAGISAASAAAIAAGQSQNITSVAELAALAGAAAANSSLHYGHLPLDVVEEAAKAASETAAELGGLDPQQAAAAAAAAAGAGDQIGLSQQESCLAGAAGAGELAQQSASSSGVSGEEQARQAGAASAAVAAACGLDASLQASAAAAAAAAAAQKASLSTEQQISAAAAASSAALASNGEATPEVTVAAKAAAAAMAAAAQGENRSSQVAAAVQAALEEAAAQALPLDEQTILVAAAAAAAVYQDQVSLYDLLVNCSSLDGTCKGNACCSDGSACPSAHASYDVCGVDHGLLLAGEQIAAAVQWATAIAEQSGLNATAPELAAQAAGAAAAAASRDRGDNCTQQAAAAGVAAAAAAASANLTGAEQAALAGAAAARAAAVSAKSCASVQGQIEAAGLAAVAAGAQAGLSDSEQEAVRATAVRAAEWEATPVSNRTTTFTSTSSTFTSTTTLPVVTCFPELSDCSSYMLHSQRCQANCSGLENGNGGNGDGNTDFLVGFQTCVVSLDGSSRLYGESACIGQGASPVSEELQDYVSGNMQIWVNSSTPVTDEKARVALIGTIAVYDPQVIELNASFIGTLVPGSDVPTSVRLLAESTDVWAGYNIDYLIKVWTLEDALQAYPDATQTQSSGTLLYHAYALRAEDSVEQTNFIQLLKDQQVDVIELRPTELIPAIISVSTIKQVPELPTEPSGNSNGATMSASTLGMAIGVVALLLCGCVFVLIVVCCGKIQQARLVQAKAEQEAWEEAVRAEQMQDNFDMVRTKISVMLPKLEPGHGPVVGRIQNVMEDNDGFNPADDVLPGEREAALRAGRSPWGDADAFTLEINDQASGSPSRMRYDDWSRPPESPPGGGPTAVVNDFWTAPEIGDEELPSIRPSTIHIDDADDEADFDESSMNSAAVPADLGLGGPQPSRDSEAPGIRPSPMVTGNLGSGKAMEDWDNS